MKLNVNGREIISADISAYETAWPIADAADIIDYFKSNNRMILGGDILTDKLVHSYDSWYCNRDDSADHEMNISRSAEKACMYIADYMKANGDTFYVVFVTE